MDLVKYVRSKGNFPALCAGVGVVMAGTGAAAIRGNMELLGASVCLLFAVAAQLWANYYNCWWVMRRVGVEEPRPRIDDGDKHGDPLKLRLIREAMTAALIISLMLGLTIMTMAEDWKWTIAVGAAMYGSGYLLNHGYGKPLYGTVWAMVMTFLFFGPIGCMATTLVQCQHNAAGSYMNLYDLGPSFYVGLAMGCLALTIHLVYSYGNYKLMPDVNPDSVTKKLGIKAVVGLIYLMGFIVLGLFIFVAFRFHFRYSMLSIVPGFIGFALNTYIAVRLPRSKVSDIRHIGRLSDLNYLLTALTLLIIWSAIGYPDDSFRTIF